MPSKKYSVRTVSRACAGGSTKAAPASSCKCQIARSDSARAAHEFGGGGGGVRPANSPAITVMVALASLVVANGVPRDVAVPEHREVRIDALVGRGQVEPDLEQLDRVRVVAVEQREHLGVDDSVAGSQPLHVAPAEPRRRAERVGVVDQAAPHERDRLEPTMRVLRKAGNRFTVIHAPTVAAREVLAEIPTLEAGVGAEAGVPLRIGVVVMDAEEERVERGPLEAERNGLYDGIGGGDFGHGPTLAAPRVVIFVTRA